LIEIVSLPLSALDRGLLQPQVSAFYSSWRRGDGLAGMPRALSNQLTLSAGIMSGGFAPPLLSVGPASFVAECFGADWAREAIMREHTPDDALERAAAAGYLAAFEGVPSLDIVTCKTQNEDGMTMDILYERLIVLMPTGAGVPVLACMTAKLKPICWSPPPDGRGLAAGSSTNSHRRGYEPGP